jgi:hypothetical protein
LRHGTIVENMKMGGAEGTGTASVNGYCPVDAARGRTYIMHGSELELDGSHQQDDIDGRW